MSAVLLLLLACQGNPNDSDPGTFVGNPGELDVAASQVPGEVALDSVWVSALDWVTQDCDGVSTTVAINTSFDAIDGVFDGVVVPGGDFCAGQLTVSEPIRVQGITTSGTAFTYVLDVPWIDVNESFRIDGEQLLVAIVLDGIDAAALDQLGDGIVLDASSSESQALANELAQGALLHDVNQNGIDDGDLPLALAYSADENSGCSVVRGEASWLWLGVLGLVFRRRQRR